MQTYSRTSHVIQNFREIIGRGFMPCEHLNAQLNTVALSHLSPVLIEPYELSTLRKERTSYLPP